MALCKPSRFSYVLLIGLITLFLITSCSYQPSSLERTEVPIFVAPPMDTPTTQPSPTPDPASLIQIGKEVQSPAGGFAFTPITVWDQSGMPLSVHISPERVTMNNEGSTLFFSMINDRDPQVSDLQSCLQASLDRMAEDIQNFSPSEVLPLELPAGNAVTSTVSGNILGTQSSGQLLVLKPGESCFTLFGLATSENSEQLWQSSGQAIFEIVAQSLRFLEDSEILFCEIASDPSYGFNPENPIRVGNTNLYDGRIRQENYLLTLRGPAGEEVYFSRLTPIFNDLGGIVDPYRIEYAKIPDPVTLYFDMYNFESPLAPMGFSCEAAFPISEP
jgi:hypothetical protein